MAGDLLIRPECASGSKSKKRSRQTAPVLNFRDSLKNNVITTMMFTRQALVKKQLRRYAYRMRRASRISLA
jgi:hypothetical protein